MGKNLKPELKIEVKDYGYFHGLEVKKITGEHGQYSYDFGSLILPEKCDDLDVKRLIEIYRMIWDKSGELR